MTASIAAFFLGGTISMAGHAGGAVARLDPRELVASVPSLDGVELDARDFRRLPSACLRFADVVELAAAAADAAVADGAVGVVVVQGTDTIEETAYLLDLLWMRDEPLVVTGAMRNPTLPGADGPANLLAAVTVAGSAGARGSGVLVVLNDEIHAARHVAKRHSSRPSAFASPNAGPVGSLVEGQPVFTATVARRAALPVPIRTETRVALVTITFSDDGGLVDAIGERFSGLVVAGFGVGHVPDRLAERLGAIATRIPTVLASRTGAGSVFRGTYGFAGSETDLLARGLIPAGLLDPLKARILLWTVLAGGGGRAAVESAFAAER